MSSTHLNVRTPLEYRGNGSGLFPEGMPPLWPKAIPPKGVSQRSEAIRWLVSQYNRDSNTGGQSAAQGERSDFSPDAIVYFADDDNAYDLRLFDEVDRFSYVIILEYYDRNPQTIPRSYFTCCNSFTHRLPFQDIKYHLIAEMVPRGLKNNLSLVSIFRLFIVKSGFSNFFRYKRSLFLIVVKFVSTLNL